MSIKDLRRQWRESHVACIQLDREIRALRRRAENLALDILHGRLAAPSGSGNLTVRAGRDGVTVTYQGRVVLETTMGQSRSSVGEYVPGPDTWERLLGVGRER